MQDLTSHVKARYLANAFHAAAATCNGLVTLPKLQYHQPCLCILSSDDSSPGSLQLHTLRANQCHQQCTAIHVSLHMPWIWNSSNCSAADAGQQTKTALLVEPFIPGDFMKWHLNNGTVLQVEIY